jgi:pimeloyl-ACP methyl ester carboxylesterase
VVLVFHDAGGGYDEGAHVGGFLESEGFEVISPSRPGYLRTPLSVGATPTEQAQAAAALLDRLAVPHVAVLGQGFGGTVACEFARLFPNRTAALVLVSAVTAPLNPEPVISCTDSAAMRFSRRPLASALRRAYDFTTIGTAEEKEAWVESILSDASQSEYFQSLIDCLTPPSPRKQGLQNDLLQISLLSPTFLKDIHTPTLIVHGQKDKIVPFTQAEMASSVFTRPLFLPLPDTGHIAFLGSVGRGAQARIAEFFKNHHAATSPTSR